MFKKSVVYLMIGVIMTGCAKEASTAVYRGQTPELKFSLRYPADWEAREFRDPHHGLGGATFTQKAQKGVAYRPFFAVTAKKATAFRLAAVNLQTVTQDALDRALKLDSARLLERSQRKVAGLPATEAVVAYRGLSDIYRADARVVQIREKIVIAQAGDLFYVIRYCNSEEAFSRFDKAFARACDSFQILP
jgi:hypothetical protein